MEMNQLQSINFNQLSKSIAIDQSRGSSAGDGASMFWDVFQNTVNNVRETQKDVENKQYLLATGQLTDAHSLPIAEAKAAVSLDLLISLRNKAMESYNELIKMQL
jgi:flagellar hook-basal body complex protein FliE